MAIAQAAHQATLSPFNADTHRIISKNEAKLPKVNAAAVSTKKKLISILHSGGSAPLQAILAGDHIPFTKHNGLQYRIEESRKRFASKDIRNLEELIMIDTLHRLGLNDYFREEIHVVLQKHYAKFCNFEQSDDDLYHVALRFRLLRQAAYDVPIDIFNKFKDTDGKFKQELCQDEKCLLSLYEASQLSKQGEDILDEVNKFSSHILEATLRNATEPRKTRIIESILRHPHHKNSARLTAKSFLHVFIVSFETLHNVNINDSWMNGVQDLARIDFDVAQTSHRNELRQLSRWGKALGSAKELEFARIEPIKWYLWSLGTFPGPSMAKERVELAKAVSFIYIIDDIFDVYGTPEELSLFTNIIKRWSYVDSVGVPNYMMVCFDALRKLTSEFSSEVLRKHGWNPEYSLRKVWADMSYSFLVESKWSANSRQMPSSKEYLKNGIVSSGTHVVLTHAFFLLGENINKNSVEELNRLPSIISSTGTIVRLWNDVGTDKDENRENDLSYIDYYIKEHKGYSLESARLHVTQMISDAWKCLNAEYMSPPSPFSTDFKLACINFARMVPIVYSHYGTHHLKNLMKILNSPEDK